MKPSGACFNQNFHKKRKIEVTYFPFFFKRKRLRGKKGTDEPDFLLLLSRIELKAPFR